MNQKKAPPKRGFSIWRPRSELNRRTRICSPLHNHSATRPDDVSHLTETTKPRVRGFIFNACIQNLEREKGLEPSTPTLARSCSTN
jgi:hypothetical protein